MHASKEWQLGFAAWCLIDFNYLTAIGACSSSPFVKSLHVIQATAGTLLVLLMLILINRQLTLFILLPQSTFQLQRERYRCINSSTRKCIQVQRPPLFLIAAAQRQFVASMTTLCCFQDQLPISWLKINTPSFFKQLSPPFFFAY